MKKKDKKKKTTRRRLTRSTNQYVGHVVMGTIYANSKSEREAVKLDTGDDELIMRRTGVRVYKDEVLEELVGQRVIFKGLKRGNKLYVRSWEVAEEDADS